MSRYGKNGWGIFEKHGKGYRRYIPRLWPEKKEAERELEDLLRYYPAEHPWRKRLVLIQVVEGALNIPWGRPASTGDEKPN